MAPSISPGALNDPRFPRSFLVCCRNLMVSVSRGMARHAREVGDVVIAVVAGFNKVRSLHSFKGTQPSEMTYSGVAASPAGVSETESRLFFLRGVTELPASTAATASISPSLAEAASSSCSPSSIAAAPPRPRGSRLLLDDDTTTTDPSASTWPAHPRGWASPSSCRSAEVAEGTRTPAPPG